MLAWQTTNNAKAFAICLISIAVMFCSFAVTSAASLHSLKRQTNETAIEHGSGELEPLDQQSVATYDQRQSGKYNIHVNIKDVKIVYGNRGEFEGSLDDDTVYDYGEYDYDPSHLTVSPLPIFGIGSVSLTSSKPPKSSTESPISTINHITKRTTTKPQPTTIKNPPATSNLITSTTEIHAPDFDATTTPFAQKQPIETHTSSSTMSSQPSTSTSSIKTTAKPVKVQPESHDSQHIPVQVIVEPYLKRKS